MILAPIVVFGFNRPKLFARVLDRVFQVAQGRRVYIFIDGARQGRPADAAGVSAVAQLADSFSSRVSGVKVVLRGKNMGCRHSIEDGLDQVFRQEERAIIIEDDCLPDPTFFSYCDNMLSTYAEQANVGMISGDNFLTDRMSDDHFSRYPLIWGWATWARVWRLHDKSMSSFDQGGVCPLIRYLGSVREALYWRHYFMETRRGRIDTWDYQLTWTFFEKKMLTICPAVNLIENIGFGADATHTFFARPGSRHPANSLRLDSDRRPPAALSPELQNILFTRRFGGFTFFQLAKLELKRLRFLFKW
jgi:hypothetical protein